MRRELRELTRLTFVGEDFEDHGLELGILSELAAYKKLVVETAKALWRERNPERKNLPPGFEDAIRLKITDIEPGSARVTIKREVIHEEEEAQMALPAVDQETEPNPVDEAAELIEEAVEAVSHDGILPQQMPSNVIPLFGEFGRSLRPGHEIRMKAAGRSCSARYTPETRDRIANWTEPYYEDVVSVSGQVRQADLDGCNFTLRLDDGAKVSGKFDSQYEDLITGALREHASRWLHVQGAGRFQSATGRLDRITRVDSLVVETPGEETYDSSVKPIWEQIIEIGATVPEEVWEQLPTDLAANLDHYLYGEGRFSQ